MPTNAPIDIPTGMLDYVHAYSGVWAIAGEAASTLLAVARRMDVAAHLDRQAQRLARAQRRACDQCDEDQDDEEDDQDTNNDGGPEADKKKKRSATLASLPGIQPAGAFEGYITADGIAVIEARGTLMKFSSSFSAGTSTVRLRRTIREAVNDPRVRAVLLVMDSPGGTVAGTAELADDLAAANKKKPVWVYGEDLLASAAYWVASGAARIGAGRTALVGSCGSILVVDDVSKAFTDAGIEVKVYKSGTLKGAGTFGTKVTEEHDEYFQSIIDETTVHFRAAVETGRPRAKVEAVFSDAGVYLAAKAKSRGLVDAVCSVEEFYGQLVKSIGGSAAKAGKPAATQEQTPDAQDDDARQADGSVVDSPAADAGEGVDVSTTTNPTGATPGAAGGAQPAANTPPVAATLQQLEAACPGASAEFLVAQLKGNATVESARGAYMGQLIVERDAALAANAAKPGATAAPPATQPGAAAAPATSSAAPAAGVAPIATKPSAKTGETDTSASEELDRRAGELVASHKMSLTAARQRILSRDKDLRERFNAEQIEERKATRAETMQALAGAT